MTRGSADSADGGVDPAGRGEGLEAILIADVDANMARWRRQYADQPDMERNRLFLFALEREQIVVVAYREDAIAERVAELEVSDDAKALIRQTLVWIWKDEQLHSEYIRGELLRVGGLMSTVVVYGRQVQGALSGWASATRNLRGVRSAPLRSGTAGLLVAVAGALRRIPPELQRELRYQTFRHYCELNVALELSAEFAYRRLVELARSEEERSALDRIRSDEARHAAAFRFLATSLTEDDRLAERASTHFLSSGLGDISPWFVPASLRPLIPAPEGEGAVGASGGGDRAAVATTVRIRPDGEIGFGSRARVAVRSGRTDAEKLDVLEQCLDAAGLAEVASTAISVAIRVAFMMGYDRRDRSNINDPELVDGLACYLRRHGVQDVAVLEAPTVYGNSFGNRSVESVAAYFGFDSTSYRVVDMHRDLRPVTFDRGMVQQAISGTWLDADLRIVMSKLRTDPTEFAHLSLSTMVGSTGPINETFYSGRQVDFRSATMMLIDVAPPDFALVDCWAPVADGPFGVMGCDRPVDIRYLYAGADALSVDEAVLSDLGIADARQAPIVARAYHWFGLAPSAPEVDGERPNLRKKLRGAHSSALLRALGALSYPVYAFLSNQGELFVPAVDTDAFPPVTKVPATVRFVRWSTQRAFGLHPPES